jgi:Tol biopolymer transport system component
VGRILFVRGTHIWSVNPDGTGARQLTRARVLQDGSPTWSPNHRSIAFIRRTGTWKASKASVWIMTSSGGAQHRLSYRGPSIAYRGLAWSPDGRQLAGGNFSEYPWRGHVALLNLRTLRSRNVFTLARSPNGIESLSWSPDSHQLLVGQEGGDSGWIVRIDARSGNVLERYGISIGWAAFSPDGTTIAYQLMDTANLVWGIRLMTATGDLVKILTDGGGTPVWSPDAMQIAYAYYTTSGGTEVWVMNADGSDQHRVIRNGWVQAWQ